MHILLYAALGFLGYKLYTRSHGSGGAAPPPAAANNAPPGAAPAPTPTGENPGDRNAVPEANQ